MYIMGKKRKGMIFLNRFIYADNAATTKLKSEVLQEMMPYLTDYYGNPSSIYEMSSIPAEAIAKARAQVAAAIGAEPNEIIFTSGATEADNWACKGIAYVNKGKKNHIITSKIEHHAILHSLKALEKDGYEVTYLDVDEDGLVNPADVEAAIKEETCLITIMYANNEIGTIEPIAEIGKIAKAHGVIFHTDAVQAIGNVEINVKEQNIDMLSISAHKFHGPKGVGALYVRKGIKLFPYIDGGAQERKRRAGTENVAGIVGMGAAITMATADIPGKIKRLSEMRDELIRLITEKIPFVRLNGHREKRLCGNVNMCFRYIEGEALLLSLDLAGISASSGSACTSGSLDPSHVLLAIGLPHEIAHGSLRVSLGDFNTMEDVKYIADQLVIIVERLRAMSPLYEAAMKG